MVGLRPARRGESAALSDLTFRSKAYWGYDETFMETCREELRVTEEAIAAGAVAVLEAEGRPVGVYAIALHGDDAELILFFVEPDAIGDGYGRRLWEGAVEACRDGGATVLRIESDPGAEGFYLRMGAERVGEAPSDSIPGRTLPLLRYEL